MKVAGHKTYPALDQLARRGAGKSAKRGSNKKLEKLTDQIGQGRMADFVNQSNFVPVPRRIAPQVATAMEVDEPNHEPNTGPAPMDISPVKISRAVAMPMNMAPIKPPATSWLAQVYLEQSSGPRARQIFTQLPQASHAPLNPPNAAAPLSAGGKRNKRSHLSTNVALQPPAAAAQPKEFRPILAVHPKPLAQPAALAANPDLTTARSALSQVVAPKPIPAKKPQAAMEAMRISREMASSPAKKPEQDKSKSRNVDALLLA